MSLPPALPSFASAGALIETVCASAPAVRPASRGRSRRKAEREETNPRRREGDAEGPEGFSGRPDGEVEKESGGEDGRRGPRGRAGAIMPKLRTQHAP
ncbi:MAG: hypothetical protein OXN16_13325, partial [Gammaproteobacteria bacterium]|nr:hypothetical protein [Gammaproteobacteria bacterium]